MKTRTRIIKKFGSLARFAAVSGIPYYTLRYAMKHGGDKSWIETKIYTNNPVPIGREMTGIEFDQIRGGLEGMELPLKDFCKRYGWRPYYVKSVLDGEVRFKSRRVIKLMNDITTQIKAETKYFNPNEYAQSESRPD